MIPYIVDHLERHFRDLFPGEDIPVSLVPVKAPGKPGARSKVNVLVFDDQGRILAACAFPRSPDAGEVIELEGGNMRRFREAFGRRSAGRAIPGILYQGGIEGVETLIREGVPGVSLREILASGRAYRKWMLLCGAWLADLHGATTSERVEVTRDRLDAWLNGPFVALQEAFPDPERYRMIAPWIEEACDALEGMEVPIAGQHGDFNGHNIRVHENRFFVVDWEDARFDLPPFLDLNLFIMTSAHQMKSGLGPAESLRRIALSNGPFRDAAHDMNQAYCRDLEIPSAFPMLMAPACMIHMAHLYREPRRGQEKAARHWVERLACFAEICNVGECW